MALAAPLVLAGLVGFALADKSSLSDPLTWALVGIGSASALMAAFFSGPLTVSPAFICGMLAIAFLGPAAAFLVTFVAEVVAWLYERYRWRAFVMNLAGIPLPALIVAYGFQAIGPEEETVAFFVLLALATALDLALNAAIVLPIGAILDGRTVRSSLGALVALLPTFGISMVLTLAIAEGYISNGLAALALLLVVIAVDRVHVPPGHPLPRAGAGVREPLVGHPVEPRPHARRARPPRRPALRRGRAVRPRHRRARASCPSATRSWRTPPGCCTTSASSPCRIA